MDSTDLTAGAFTRDRPERRASALALWHLLSLDAPCVAAVWTVFLAYTFKVSLPWTAPAALSLAVWMLYVADRLADAAAGKALEERHCFHQRHSAAFAVGWMACVPVLLWLVMHLPHELRDGWLLLAIPLAAYVGAVHTFQLRHVPKEPLIALFFGMAVAMPVISSGVLSEGLAASTGLFCPAVLAELRRDRRMGVAMERLRRSADPVRRGSDSRSARSSAFWRRRGLRCSGRLFGSSASLWAAAFCCSCCWSNGADGSAARTCAL